MHANLTELLAARDGEKGLASAHISNCKFCQNEIAQLDSIANDLKQLPARLEPSIRWEDIVSRHKLTNQSQANPHSRLNKALYMLAASVFFVGITSIIFLSQPNQVMEDHSLIELQAQSSALEYVLSNYSDNDLELSPLQKFRIEQLQWQLIRLDQKIVNFQDKNKSKKLKALWTERVNHLNTLHSAHTSSQNKERELL